MRVDLDKDATVWALILASLLTSKELDKKWRLIALHIDHSKTRKAFLSKVRALILNCPRTHIADERIPFGIPAHVWKVLVVDDKGDAVRSTMLTIALSTHGADRVTTLAGDVHMHHVKKRA